MLFAVDLSGLRADDAFQMPVPASPDAPVTANFGDTPAPSTDRWARRNQQMRDALAQGTGGVSQSSNQPFASQQPLAPQQFTQQPFTQLTSAQQPLAQPGQQPTMQPAAAQFGAYAQQPMDLSQRVPPAPAQSANAYPQQFAATPGGTNYLAQGQKLPFSGKFGSSTQRQGPIPDLGNLPEAEQAKTPAQLPKVTQILPFLDYEPDPKVAAEDPCQNLCPRPDGAPCKTPDGKGPECPKEIQLSSGPFEPRVFPASTYTWQASNIFYQPLYFEDPDLERYGHAYPFFIQPIVSSLRFTTQAIGLPYQMTIDPPCCRVYPLGYYRPGECAPKLIYQIPWNTEAAAVEAGAITGVYFLFPHSAWAM